jgi:hypothetical protein
MQFIRHSIHPIFGFLDALWCSSKDVGVFISEYKKVAIFKRSGTSMIKINAPEIGGQLDDLLIRLTS